MQKCLFENAIVPVLRCKTGTIAKRKQFYRFLLIFSLQKKSDFIVLPYPIIYFKTTTFWVKEREINTTEQPALCRFVCRISVHR